ncbi:hypothetical protein ACNKHS_23055 [Shigella flexneri]
MWRLPCTGMSAKLVIPLLVSSSLLFYIGIAFPTSLSFRSPSLPEHHTARKGCRYGRISPAPSVLSWRCLWPLVSPLRCRSDCPALLGGRDVA